MLNKEIHKNWTMKANRQDNKTISQSLWYRVNWSPEIEQYSIAYEVIFITFKISYYKKQNATSCEKYGISRFYLN